jgi:hypothetical protein
MIFQVDLTAVTNAIGYKNVASVGNKFRAMKKRFDFKLSTKNGSGLIASLMAADASPASASLPSADGPEPVVPKSILKKRAAAPLKGNGRRKGAKVEEGPVPAGPLQTPDVTETQPKPKGQRGRRKNPVKQETDAPASKQAKAAPSGYYDVAETVVATIGDTSFYIPANEMANEKETEVGGDTEAFEE